MKENHPTFWGGDGATRCADSYFVSKTGARKLMTAKALQRPYTLPIDWALNEAMREPNFKAYWMEPTVAHQGSQSGRFGSASHSP